jgi:hypothetical protein
VIWTHNRSLAGQQGISSPISLLASLLSGLFSHLRYECQCDERLKTISEKSTRLTYTALFGELEFLKIETSLIDEMFESVMGEYVFLK